MKTTPFLLFFLFTPFFAKPQAVQHPLDPLSWQEHWTVLEVLREAGHLDEKTRFSMVNLAEPDKTLVKQWTPGKPFPRSAYAVVHQENDSYEALIDLGGEKSHQLDQNRRHPADLPGRRVSGNGRGRQKGLHPAGCHETTRNRRLDLHRDLWRPSGLFRHR